MEHKIDKDREGHKLEFRSSPGNNKKDDLGMQGESPYTPPAGVSADKQT